MVDDTTCGTHVFVTPTSCYPSKIYPYPVIFDDFPGVNLLVPIFCLFFCYCLEVVLKNGIPESHILVTCACV